MPPKLPHQARKGDHNAKHWCATVNESVDDRITERFIAWIQSQKYFSFQSEIGEKGNRHIQAYFGADTQQWGSKLINKFPGIHFEVARSPGLAFEYCQKESTRDPRGISGRSELSPAVAKNNGGGGSHWTQAYKAIQSGASIGDIEQQFPELGLRYRNVLLDAIGRRDRSTDLQSQISALSSGAGIRTQLAQCTILWGPPGTGKTTRNRIKALELCRDEGLRLYVAKDDQWFQDYNGEEIILLQDIAPKQYKQSFLLQVMDGWMVWFPIKNGGAYGTLKYVFMDSNHDPLTWFTPAGQKPTPAQEELAQAIIRRCDEGRRVIYVPNPLLDENKGVTPYERIMAGGLRRREVRTKRKMKKEKVLTTHTQHTPTVAR